ncbi:hypothetical protein THAOC_32377 [Thalassiosira oceanica]|uniref:Uncharacterized protein n=1 Tax=Thalassiosira oceanica TaxID=159749 RepID=K0R7C6_THAOC|nr:hypothetical protein THAOC_32377 [Thalassiosira oceanica]|eukprot:EJK48795.1 hypothetical protein THAOC_32377 [Thalassiosira oceanica]
MSDLRTRQQMLLARLLRMHAVEGKGEFNSMPGANNKTKYECIHGCGWWNRTWLNWSATHARQHSLECDKVPSNTKKIHTQAAKRERRVASMTASSGSTAARESFSSIRNSASAAFVNKNSKRKRQMNYDITRAYNVDALLTKQDTKKIIKEEVEAC